MKSESDMIVGEGAREGSVRTGSVEGKKLGERMKSGRNTKKKWGEEKKRDRNFDTEKCYFPPLPDF